MQDGAACWMASPTMVQLGLDAENAMETLDWVVLTTLSSAEACE
jgi:hypothetical protein